jgi:hypothetical protein
MKLPRANLLFIMPKPLYKLGTIFLLIIRFLFINYLIIEEFARAYPVRDMILTAPNLGIWTEDGWIVENEGVSPDIEVEQWPAEVAAGHDPQLEKAIQVVMEELKANPPKKLVRPPFPIRVK